MRFCRKNILLLIFSSFISVGLGQDCDEGFVWIDDPPLNEYNWDGYNCFYELDLNVLSEFIQLNSSLSGQHLDIGWQYWVNGRLEGLTLYALQLTSIPNNIGSLNNLTYLNLHFNQITNIPETIGELTQLTEIYLENNLFGTLPESIGNLTNLITLNINENQLISIPENIGNLTGLEELLLYNNSLTSLPESICNIFSNLSQYDFSDNYICPPYPYCIENVGYQDTTNCEPECDLGDINCDGDLNVLDVVLMVNMILTAEYDEISDINQDGLINILDVVQLVNIILGVTQNTINDIDGNVYETVQIGGQLWMAENLTVTHYNNGDEIPNITNNSDWGVLFTGAYCDYDNNPTNSGTYGRIYNWYTIDDDRGVCPDEWHIPSDDEFMELEMFLGMGESETNSTGYRGTDEGSMLADNLNLWNSGILVNNNEFGTSGFSSLPSGYRFVYYGFQNMGNNCSFWSSSEGTFSYAWYRLLDYNYSSVLRTTNSKHNGFSIRCIKD